MVFAQNLVKMLTLLQRTRNASKHERVRFHFNGRGRSIFARNHAVVTIVLSVTIMDASGLEQLERFDWDCLQSAKTLSLVGHQQEG